jgi:hypothetical protein
MMIARRAVLVAIVVLASPAIFGCIAQPDVAKTYHGHYQLLRGVSSLKPCDLEELWWVYQGTEFLREHLAGPDGPVGGELYIEVTGIVSERGSFGRFGAYDRMLEIQSVSLLGAPRKHCSQ